jgi:hypothetical protein
MLHGEAVIAIHVGSAANRYVWQDAFQKQMILERSDVKRRWHLEVHHGSLKCVRVSLAPRRSERFAGKGPARSGAFPLLALSECQ